MPPAFTIDTTTWRSPNYGSRAGTPIKSLVVHSCEGRPPHPRATSLPWLCKPSSGVSAHYYVCRDGTIYQLVDDQHVAWHAGVCLHAFRNEVSLGVECEHHAGQDWPIVQCEALTWLVRRLIETYQIALVLVETHGQIALPGPYVRKDDPSDWTHADFLVWRSTLIPAPNEWLHVRGLPVYERQDRTGAVADYLTPADTVEIGKRYDDGTMWLADGRGFVDGNGLEQV